MLTLVLTVGLSSVVLLVAMSLFTRTRLLDGPPECPSCAVPLMAIPRPDPTTAYDVLLCPRCPNTLTAVHGGPSHFAHCPACRQRTLEVSAHRAPSDHAEPMLHCEEVCHVCGYGDEFDLPIQFDIHEPPQPNRTRPPRGDVIPFPVRRDPTG